MGTVWPVSDRIGSLDASDGELLVRTGVTGRAAKMGHRLTLLMNSWDATVRWTDGQPVAAHLTVDVDGLAGVTWRGWVDGPFRAGEVTGAVARPEIAGRRAVSDESAFRPTTSTQTDDGYRLRGTLDIHGTSRACAVDLRVEDLGETWRMSGEADVRQTEFGVKPYSMLMGAMKVVDIVTVAFTAVRNDGPDR